MSINFIKGLGRGAVEWIDKVIPEPDIAIWMGDATSKERGKKVAKKVLSVAVPFFFDGVFKGIGTPVNPFVTGLIGAGIAVATSLINIGKAWVINKIIDKVIKEDSPYSLLKDEIKKVTDAAVGLVVAVAFLVAGIFAGFLGPAGIVTAALGVALAVGTLVRASKQLHDKRTNPGTRLQMDMQREVQKSRMATTYGMCLV